MEDKDFMDNGDLLEASEPRFPNNAAAFHDIYILGTQKPNGDEISVESPVFVNDPFR